MFYDEVANILNIAKPEFAVPRIILYGKVGVSIEGHRGLLYFSDGEIRFRVRGGVVSIAGEKLQLFEVTEKEAVVSGRVTAVSYV